MSGSRGKSRLRPRKKMITLLKARETKTRENGIENSSVIVLLFYLF